MWFGNSLWSCQIYEVDLRIYLSRSLHIDSLDIQDENAMRSWWGLIHTCATDFPQIVPHHKIIKRLFFRFTSINRTIFETKVLILILHQNNFGPLLKIIIPIPLLKQIIGTLIVNFDIWNAEFVLYSLSVSLKLLKDVTQHSGNNSALLPFIPSTHCVSFSTASLPICKYSSVITLQTVVNHRLSQLRKYLLLAALLFEYPTEAKVMLLLWWRKLCPVSLQNYPLVVMNGHW